MSGLGFTTSTGPCDDQCWVDNQAPLPICLSCTNEDLYGFDYELGLSNDVLVKSYRVEDLQSLQNNQEIFHPAPYH